jgi:uncharacterized protein YegJ (DUF2314 family)
MVRIRRLKFSIVAINASLLLKLNVQATNLMAQEIEKSKDQTPYYEVPNDDTAIRRAVIQARKTVGKFITALQHRANGQKDFEIKKPFIQNGQMEHIWLSDVEFVGNRFQARVDNEPRKIRGVKIGQLVSVNPNEITDWLYIDNGKLVGGYTFRVQYNQLSPQDKQEFDQAADFKIEQ